jgi:hypothetical protein
MPSNGIQEAPVVNDKMNTDPCCSSGFQHRRDQNNNDWSIKTPMQKHINVLNTYSTTASQDEKTLYRDSQGMQRATHLLPLRRLPNQIQHMLHHLLSRRHMPTCQRSLTAISDSSRENSFWRHRELYVTEGGGSIVGLLIEEEEQVVEHVFISLLKRE